jgi:hypothetical protein
MRGEEWIRRMDNEYSAGYTLIVVYYTILNVEAFGG